MRFSLTVTIYFRDNCKNVCHFDVWTVLIIGSRFVNPIKDTDVTYQPNGPNWPSLLDSFSLIAGQIATLIKYLKHPNTPVLG